MRKRKLQIEILTFKGWQKAGEKKLRPISLAEQLAIWIIEGYKARIVEVE